MSRTIKEIQLDQPIDVVSMVMDDFIYHNHFMRTDWEGEMVFSAEDSHGGMKYFKWSYAGGMFRAESWVKGPMGGEDSLSGVYQGATKRAFAKDLDALYLRLKTEAGSNLSGGHIGTDPLHHSDAGHSNHENWTKDTVWQKDADRYQDQSTQQSWNERTTVSDYYAGSAPRTDNRLPGTDPRVLQLCIFAIIAGLFIPVAGLIIAVIAKSRAKGTGSEHTVNVLVTIVFIIVGLRFLIAFLVPFLGFMMSGLF
ncbi:MAG: hypothetical protein ACI4FY_11060 [Acetatifactor sp.]